MNWQILLNAILIPSCLTDMKTETEQTRVPQYDVELKLAALEILKWKAVAELLYAVRGCHKTEHRRQMAEAAFLKAKGKP